MRLVTARREQDGGERGEEPRRYGGQSEGEAGGAFVHGARAQEWHARSKKACRRPLSASTDLHSALLHFGAPTLTARPYCKCNTSAVCRAYTRLDYTRLHPSSLRLYMMHPRT